MTIEGWSLRERHISANCQQLGLLVTERALGEAGRGRSARIGLELKSMFFFADLIKVSMQSPDPQTALSTCEANFRPIINLLVLTVGTLTYVSDAKPNWKPLGYLCILKHGFHMFEGN